MTTTNSSWSAIATNFPIVENLEQVSDEQLSRYAKLIYDRTGNPRLPAEEDIVVETGFAAGCGQTGIKNFEEYYEHLRRLRPNEAEWDAFLQEITTHETYLFRDETQWQWFREVFLAEFAARVKEQSLPKRLRVWSAACSTGDEAMTIATCVAASLPNVSTWDVRIVGTDIGVGAVEQARSGVFGERAMRLVPPALRDRFFHAARDARIWQAKPVIASMACFRQHNLMEPLREKPFDITFLKNVLIYFDTASKRKVLENVKSLIPPGGLLVAGAAEGVSDMLKDFQRIQPWLYKRPE